MTDGKREPGESTLRRMLEDLKRERDEIRVKLDLARMEARDEWEELEEDLREMERRLDDFGEEARRSASKLGKELGDAFRRLRRTLKD